MRNEMESDQVKEKTKQPYEKPRLRTIELAAEEVLGTPCKLDGGGFAAGAAPCYPNGNNCVGVGS
jgi:hypothetical protein